MTKQPVVILAFALVIGMALLLVVGVVLRPWANPDSAASTKLNLYDEAPRQYTRTPPALVWKPGPINDSWQPSDTASVAEGDVAYVVYGCALCHGLKGQGASVGRSLAELEDNLLEFFVRNGSRGMPAFTETELPQEELLSIGEWLRSLERPDSAIPPQVPHTTDGRSDCLSCHGPEAAIPFPESHPRPSNDICLSCHNAE